jgi:hypothetical protein
LDPRWQECYVGEVRKYEKTLDKAARAKFEKTFKKEFD